MYLLYYFDIVQSFFHFVWKMWKLIIIFYAALFAITKHITFGNMANCWMISVIFWSQIEIDHFLRRSFQTDTWWLMNSNRIATYKQGILQFLKIFEKKKFNKKMPCVRAKMCQLLQTNNLLITNLVCSFGISILQL